MRKAIYTFALLLHAALGGIQSKSGDLLFLKEDAPAPYIFINNRILAKVNGKIISVIDVMKKMDVVFYRQYPQYASSTEVRYQYYKQGWRRYLRELINKELVVADAEEHDVKVSNGDIRQEMESLFGPNIILSLDKVGLTFDEAWKMVQGDLLIRRTLYYRANSKALRQITPKEVRAAYDVYAKENVNSEMWKYAVVSIRDTDEVRGEETANSAYRLLTEGTSLKDLPAKVKEIPSGMWAKVAVSEEFHHNEKELSPAYKEVLTGLVPGSFSKPVAQKSKTNMTVFRIFYLKDSIPAGAIPFHEIENQLKDKMLDEAIDKETEAYLNRLRRHFNVQESPEVSSDDFEPFILK